MIVKIFVNLNIFSCIQIKEIKDNTSEEIQDVKKEIEKSFRNSSEDIISLRSDLQAQVNKNVKKFNVLNYFFILDFVNTVVIIVFEYFVLQYSFCIFSHLDKSYERQYFT